MAGPGIKDLLAYLGNLATKVPKEIMVTWDPQVLWVPQVYLDPLGPEEKGVTKGPKEILKCPRKCDADMECMVLWMTWPEGVNLDLQDLQAEMDLWVHRVKKETEDTQVSKEKQEMLANLETWDPWAYQVPWVKGVLMGPTDLQAYLDKWVQWVKMAKRENVVIWAPWAILVSKVKKVTKVTWAVEAGPALKVCQAVPVTSQIVIKLLLIS